ncbi:unnamed protein product, partial [Discosporangium mesarthrocarpum]
MAGVSAPRRVQRTSPFYHWEGFSRKNTKPPWFNPRVFDKDRRDSSWVINVHLCLVSSQRSCPSGPLNKQDSRAAPFVQDDDPRVYRPTVPISLTLEEPASPQSRINLSRDGDTKMEIGWEKKLSASHECARKSRLQRLANIEASRRSEVKTTIYGQGISVMKPILYPQNVTHQQALNLEKKAGPSPTFDQPLPRHHRQDNEETPTDPWNQFMYLPYSRTRADL